MIMEHCVGGNLLSKFPYSEPAVIRIISAVLSGLQALHDSEMLHLARK
jgi:serine/threonine protein kinase